MFDLSKTTPIHLSQNGLGLGRSGSGPGLPARRPGSLRIPTLPCRPNFLFKSETSNENDNHGFGEENERFFHRRFSQIQQCGSKCGSA